MVTWGWERLAVVTWSWERLDVATWGWGKAGCGHLELGKGWMWPPGAGEWLDVVTWSWNWSRQGYLGWTRLCDPITSLLMPPPTPSGGAQLWDEAPCWDLLPHQPGWARPEPSFGKAPCASALANSSNNHAQHPAQPDSFPSPRLRGSLGWDGAGRDPKTAAWGGEKGKINLKPPQQHKRAT